MTTPKLPPNVKRQRGQARKKLPPAGPGPDPMDEPENPGGNGGEIPGQLELFPLPGDGERSPVGPRVEASRLTRFESPVPGDTLVVPNETYENLGEFFNNLPNRERYEIQVWQCDAGNPANQRKREWKGRVPLPTACTLEEAIDREYGGGVYYWRLGCDNRHASREDLPADYQAMPMTGLVRLGTPEKESEPAVNPQLALLEGRLLKAEGSQNELLGFLKELVRENKSDGKSESNAMTQLMTVVLTANQQQMQLMQSQAAVQQNFLMTLLAMSDKKSAEARESREEMMQLMMDAVRGEASGEKSMGQTIVENLPRILEGLSKVPALAQPSPRLAAPVPAPAPVPSQARPVVPAPVPVPAPAPAPAPADDYPTSIAKSCIRSWQGQVPVGLAADEAEALGSDDNFNDLLDTADQDVVAFLAMGFKAANGMEAPVELLNYANEVLLELHRRYPDEPGFPVEDPAKPVTLRLVQPPAAGPAVVPGTVTPCPPIENTDAAGASSSGRS